MFQKKNILICPLDWGLGHATRCIPIIRQLTQTHNIFIASSGQAAELLKNEFPSLQHFSLPSYKISYPVNRSMSWHMALHLPVIYAAILQEKKMVKKLIEKYKIDLLISDNRFGCYAKNIPSVFITHQINIKTPHLSKWVNKLNQNAIKKFSQCWIPDYETPPGLAGELCHPVPEKIKAKFIGLLSRFNYSSIEKLYDITVVLSGPEPQRTILEDLLFKQLFELPNLKINFIRGVYSTNENSQIKNIHVTDNMNSDKLEKLLHQSNNIICRAGYSGIMDLQFINSKVLLIPTPQQTEQEYLAQIHSRNGKFISQIQTEINVEEFLKTEFTSQNSVQDNKVDFNLLVEDIF